MTGAQPRQRARLAMVLAVLSAGVVLTGCGHPPYPTGARTELLPGSTSHMRKIADRDLHWVSNGNPDGQPVLFIHGTPGDWQAFSGFMANAALAERFHMISVDRPGFGESEAGRVEPSLARQARILQAVLDDASAPAIVVGHSLGGPIAVRLAADYPEKVSGLLLIAPSLDPELEHPRWYNHATTWLPVRWLLPRVLVHANDEVMVLHDELQALKPRWADVRAPAIIIQGQTDSLVYPANADFAATMMPAEQLRVQRVADAGHFVLWEQPQRVVDAIQALATP